MLNKVVLIGRLTRDPEYSLTSSEVPRLRFTLAVDRGYSNRQGEKQADFIDIVCWRNLADVCNKYLRKGLLTAVVGSLQVRSWRTDDGQWRQAAEVNANDVRFLEWAGAKDEIAASEEMDVAGMFDGHEVDLDLPF